VAESVKASEDPKVASDVIEGEAYQRIKMQTGADGTATDVSTANPMPVSDAGGTLSIDDGGGKVSVDDGGGSLTVDGSLDVFDANVYEYTTYIYEALAGTLNVAGAVAISGAIPAGTNAIGKLAANSGVDIGDVDVTSLTGGTVAHDAADSGNPIKVGARALTALITAVSNNDRVDLTTDKFARLLATVAPLDQRVSGTLNRTNTESGQILAAVENVAYVVTAITVVNAHATVGTKVEILDGETVKWKGYAGALGGGFSIADPNGLFVGTKNTKLAAKNVTTGADVDINVSAYKIPA
jgi:hypothetical protein